MTRYLSGVVAAVAVLCAVGIGSAAAGSAAGTWVPPDDTIVKVTGNAADGFGIHHYDGTELFPPTDSEAKAECLEYDTRVARVRCKAEVSTWYADLADIKVALKWAHQQEGGES